MESSTPAVAEWLTAHHHIPDQLREVVAELLLATEHVTEEAARTDDPGCVALFDAVAAVRERAVHLVAECRAAQALPPIPEPRAQTEFTADLTRWIDAATKMEEAAGRQDIDVLTRVAQALDVQTGT